jgi:flagellar basal-body rod modification protein FlgD
MTTNPLAGAGSPTAGNSATAQQKAMVNYDDFLQLLIAQLKNQDPTDPVDPSEQLAQLASFSQVEQSIQTNQKLDALLTGSSLTQAGSYIGKYIESADGTVKGTIASVKIYTDGIIATTTDGGKILIQAGISLADSPPAARSNNADATGTLG